MGKLRLEAEVMHPSALHASDVAAWRAMTSAQPSFSSPLLGPDFALAVGQVRDDARVAVFRRGGDPLGFLAFHARPGGLARPIGAPLSDYHALVTPPRPGFTGAQALAAAGVSALRFIGLIDPHGLFAQGVQASRAAYVITPSAGPEAYMGELRQDNPKRFKNFRRLDHKLEREVGEVRLAAPDATAASFDALIAWKREQFARTGAHDVLRPAWTRQLLQSLFNQNTGPLQGLMINLYAGDQLVAGHFGVRQGEVFHPWIASTNSTHAACSPGQVFLGRAILAMSDLGLSRYDLGPGHDHYKRPFCPYPVQVGEGLSTAASPAGRMAMLGDGAWSMAGAQRLRRRLDAIAQLELTASGRVRGVVDAMASALHRRRSPSEEVAA